MLIAQLRESVIGRHKQIVSADMIAVPERRTMRRDTSGKPSPLQLLSVIQTLPSKNRPVVKFLLFNLVRSSGKFGICLAPEIADTVPMIERDFADR